jgi:mannose-6-phosphate isomerase-like protein (cupin superfamily)
MSGTAKVSVHIDNDRVIVTEYRFPRDGDNTGWHRHGLPYVVVPLLNGRLKLVAKDGERFADMTAGVPYYRPAGVEHDVINASGGEYAFLEIEIKQA